MPPLEKIIQIVSEAIGDSMGTHSDTLYGLSNGGRLYYWGSISIPLTPDEIKRSVEDGEPAKTKYIHGWILMEDEINKTKNNG